MKHIIFSTFTVVCLLFITNTTEGQNMRKANKEFELHAFNLAINSYQAIINKDPYNAEALFKLAESYRHLNQIEQAVGVYQKAIVLPKVDPAAYFNYGQVLTNLGKYEEAKNWFLKYAETNPYVGSHYAENCDYAISLQGIPALYRVKKEYLNKPASDFGPAFYKDKVVYSSARADMKRKDDAGNANWTGGAKNQLYITSTDDNGYLMQPAFLQGEYKNSYNQGPVSYSGDGKWVIFTNNNFVNGTRQIPTSGMQMSLYIAEVTGEGDWRDAKAFPFNGSGYSTGYAHLNYDGTKVYFASDRPDGYGGYDLYVSTKSGNSWSSPQNLGSVVNSPGNEITPFVENGILFFASDWHQGLGGFDLFKADYNNGNWSRIFHLGNAINSSWDDYGLIYKTDNNIGYFTSNRAGGKGNEDIYQFSQLSDNIVISVKNSITNQPVAYATIDFSACGEAAFETNEKGEYSFQALPGLECEGKVMKSGYTTSSFEISSDGRKKLQTIEIFLTREADKYLGRVINPSDNTSIEGVFVRATNQEDGSKLETISDAKGEYRLALLPDKSYVVRYSKVGYTDTHQRISTLDGSDKSILGTVSFVPSSTRVSDVPLISDTEEGSLAESSSSSGEAVPNVGGDIVSEGDTKGSIETETISDETTVVQKGFAVQVAAMGLDQKVDPDKYSNLGELGNLYSRPQNGFKKLRVGIFESETEAEKTKTAIVKAGYKNAFIVNEVLDDTEGLEIYQLLEDEEETDNTTVTTETEKEESTPEVNSEEEIEYLVRLAAYKNPQYFKASKVSSLGVIDQRKSGDFTIMYIAGFSSLNAAETARTKAEASGFKGAYVVENKNGELVKVEL